MLVFFFLDVDEFRFYILFCSVTFCWHACGILHVQAQAYTILSFYTLYSIPQYQAYTFFHSALVYLVIIQIFLFTSIRSFVFILFSCHSFNFLSPLLYLIHSIHFIHFQALLRFNSLYFYTILLLPFPFSTPSFYFVFLPLCCFHGVSDVIRFSSLSFRLSMLVDPVLSCMRPNRFAFVDTREWSVGRIGRNFALGITRVNSPLIGPTCTRFPSTRLIMDPSVPSRLSFYIAALSCSRRRLNGRSFRQSMQSTEPPEVQSYANSRASAKQDQ